MGMLAKIRRMYFRDKVPLREIARQTGLSRNTLRRRLREDVIREPAYPACSVPSMLDPYKEQLVSWLRADSHRPTLAAYGAGWRWRISSWPTAGPSWWSPIPCKVLHDRQLATGFL